MGVRTQPGHRQLARMPSLPYWFAMDRVSAMRPALLAEYEAMPGEALKAATEARFTIAPACCRCMTGNAVRHTRMTPVRFTSSVRAHCPSSMPATSSPCMMPAALTTISRRPCSPAARSTACRTSDSRPTSQACHARRCRGPAPRGAPVAGPRPARWTLPAGIAARWPRRSRRPHRTPEPPCRRGARRLRCQPAASWEAIRPAAIH